MRLCVPLIYIYRKCHTQACKGTHCDGQVSRCPPEKLGADRNPYGAGADRIPDGSCLKTRTWARCPWATHRRGRSRAHGAVPRSAQVLEPRRRIRRRRCIPDGAGADRIPDASCLKSRTWARCPWATPRRGRARALGDFPRSAQVLVQPRRRLRLDLRAPQECTRRHAYIRQVFAGCIDSTYARIAISYHPQACKMRDYVASNIASPHRLHCCATRHNITIHASAALPATRHHTHTHTHTMA